MQISEVRHPDAVDFEGVVRDHLREVRAALESTLATNAPSALRSTAWARVGEAYFAYELLAAAAGCFTNAVALNAAEPAAWYGLAECRFDLGDYSAAIDAMQQAVERMPARSTNRPGITDARRFLGDAWERLGRLDEARREFEAALAAEPADIFTLVRIGQLDAQAGDTTRAAARFEEALRAAPHRREVTALLAAQYRQLGRTNEAEALARALQTTDRTRKVPELARPDPWRAAVRALNRSAATLHWRGIAAMATGRHRDAARAFTAALAIEPTLIPTRVSLGLCLLALGDPGAAGEILLAVLREEPTNESARRGLAHALAQTGRAADAASFCRLWQQEQPTSTIAIQSEAEIHAIARDHARAAEAYRRLMDRDAAGSFAPIGLATAQAALGAQEDALRTLDAAARNLPGRADVLLNLARLLVASTESRVRNSQRSLELTEKLVSADALAPVWETHALALAANERWSEAVEAMRLALGTLTNGAGPGLAARLALVRAAIANREHFSEPWPFADPLPGP